MLLKKWIYVLFSLFPLAIIIGNFFINISLILISTSFILLKILNKEEFNINNRNFYLLIFFFLSLVLNLVIHHHQYLRLVHLQIRLLVQQGE